MAHSTPGCQVESFRSICLSGLARDSTYLSTEEPTVPNNAGNAKTSMDRPVIAITAGDVAGIGPEVILRACLGSKSTAFCTPVLVGHPQVFREAAGLIGHELRLVEIPSESVTAGSLRHQARVACLQHQVPCLNPCGDAVLSAPRGCVSAAAGDAAFQYLISAIQLAKNGDVDAIVTAPLNKESLHLSGHHFPGHTEILAEYCGVRDFAMMLHLPETSLAPWRSMIRKSSEATSNLYDAHDGLSIAHVTLHTSIESVPQLLSATGVSEKIRLMSDFLSRIKCRRRAVAVCALNPHAGENGLFGNEEAGIIKPAVAECVAAQLNVCGPLPVDTLIRRAIMGEFDGVVAMYHDQGHIPVKLIGFDSAINITLGLPILRTSPTHGTAFDRAWNPVTPSDSNGMFEAIRMAVLLAEEKHFSLNDV